jgi:hypothetical protein
MTPWSLAAHRITARSLIAIGLTFLAFSPAYALAPSPTTSTCPPAVILTANGACCFEVTVRDALGNLVAGSVVHVDFAECAVALCPTQPPGTSVNGNGVEATTNALGVATFCICATFTPPCSMGILADGIVLCQDVPVTNCVTAVTRSTWGKLKQLYR